jgi:Gas vesicle protein G
VGLISTIVLLPVAPVKGVFWVAGKITDEANRRYYSEGAIVAELRRVDEARRSGQIDEETAAAREEELLQRRLGAPPTKGAGHG